MPLSCPDLRQRATAALTRLVRGARWREAAVCCAVVFVGLWALLSLYQSAWPSFFSAPEGAACPTILAYGVCHLDLESAVAAVEQRGGGDVFVGVEVRVSRPIVFAADLNIRAMPRCRLIVWGHRKTPLIYAAFSGSGQAVLVPTGRQQKVGLYGVHMRPVRTGMYVSALRAQEGSTVSLTMHNVSLTHFEQDVINGTAVYLDRVVSVHVDESTVIGSNHGHVTCIMGLKEHPWGLCMDGGGALYIQHVPEGAHVHVAASFVGNTHTHADGAGLYVDKVAGSVTVGGSFSANTAKDGGAAMVYELLTSQATLTVTATFTNNTAQRGNLRTVRCRGQTTIDATFIENKGEKGAGYRLNTVYAGGSVKIGGSSHGNMAVDSVDLPGHGGKGGNGGLAFVMAVEEGASVDLKGTHTANRALKSGGVLEISTLNGVATVGGSYSQNAAQVGGVIAVMSLGPRASLHLAGHYAQNMATTCNTSDGGVLYPTVGTMAHPFLSYGLAKGPCGMAMQRRKLREGSLFTWGLQGAAVLRVRQPLAEGAEVTLSGTYEGNTAEKGHGEGGVYQVAAQRDSKATTYPLTLTALQLAH